MHAWKLSLTLRELTWRNGSWSLASVSIRYTYILRVKYTYTHIQSDINIFNQCFLTTSKMGTVWLCRYWSRRGIIQFVPIAHTLPPPLSHRLSIVDTTGRPANRPSSKKKYAIALSRIIDSLPTTISYTPKPPGKDLTGIVGSNCMISSHQLTAIESS